MSMRTETIPIGKVFPNIGQVKGLPKNPRFIRDDKYRKLLQSIKDDPEMLELRELIVYDTGDPELGYVVAGGNMRYRAMKELGYKEVPCKVLHPGFPMDKLRRIVLKDNSSFGDTDFASLVSEWSLDEIEMSAIDVPEIYMPRFEEKEEPQEKPVEPREERTEEPVEEEPEPTPRMESRGEIDVSDFEVRQTLRLDFTPREYLFVLGKLAEYGDNNSQALLSVLGWVEDGSDF